MHGTRPTSSTAANSRAISIRIARDPNDLMLVTAIRAAVYLAEQDCPMEEEFDGNDLVAAHFLGFVGSEPGQLLHAIADATVRCARGARRRQDPAAS